MYCRARLCRNSSTTSSKVVPSLANLRASVRVLMARFFAILCLRALPCGSNFCASFSTKARNVPGAVSRCLAASSQIGRRVSSKWMSSVMRGKARLRLEKTSSIGRAAKFDRTAAEPLKLREARAAHMDKGYFCRVNILACDLAQTLHDNCDSKLSVLQRPKPRNADQVKFDDEVTVPSRKFYANGFVYDPEITRKELYRVAKILRCGRDVEQQSYLSRIHLCGKVETERRIVERLSSVFEEPGLRSGGDANLVFFQSLFGQAKALQQGSRVDTVIPKRDQGVPPGESGGRWQAGNPSVGHFHAPFAKPVEINCRSVPNQDVRTAGSSTKLARVAIPSLLLSSQLRAPCSFAE